MGVSPGSLGRARGGLGTEASGAVATVASARRVVRLRTRVPVEREDAASAGFPVFVFSSLRLCSTNEAERTHKCTSYTPPSRVSTLSSRNRRATQPTNSYTLSHSPLNTHKHTFQTHTHTFQSQPKFMSTYANTHTHTHTHLFFLSTTPSESDSLPESSGPELESCSESLDDELDDDPDDESDMTFVGRVRSI